MIMLRRTISRLLLSDGQPYVTLLNQLQRDFFIVFLPSDVTMNAMCSCSSDARRQGNDRLSFRPFSFFFFNSWKAPRCLVTCSCADLSPDLKIFSLCQHLVILPTFPPWTHLILTLLLCSVKSDRFTRFLSKTKKNAVN